MNAGVSGGGLAVDEHRPTLAPYPLPVVTWSLEEEARATRLDFILSCIDLFEGGPAIKLSLERCFKACIGLKVRQTQARRHLKSALKDHCILRWQSETAAIVRLIEPRTGPDMFRECIAGHLADVASEPLTPRFLTAALAITSRERLRWTKDGRLKQGGSVTIKRGQLISVPTYSISDVEFLDDNPATIAQWRASDAEHNAR